MQKFLESQIQKESIGGIELMLLTAKRRLAIALVLEASKYDFRPDEIKTFSAIFANDLSLRMMQRDAMRGLEIIAYNTKSEVDFMELLGKINKGRTDHEAFEILLLPDFYKNVKELKYAPRFSTI